MENERDKLVVILAGYKDRMDVFFASNPGMSSRVAHHLDFAAYELGELGPSARQMLGRRPTTSPRTRRTAFREYLTGRMGSPGSPTPAASATSWSGPGSGTPHRLAADQSAAWTRDDLMRLEPSDVRLGADLTLATELPGQPASR